MQQLQDAVRNVFVQLSATLTQLTHDQYVQPCKNLFGNTIGQHVRHIIELFQCLENGYETGIVNYERRKRDKLIETDHELACRLLPEVLHQLARPNRELTLEISSDDMHEGFVGIQTNYIREIAYNLEHTIHHMALIRVGVSEAAGLQLSEEFGVASATIKYRKSCAQ